jgi:hypothetical protein
LFDDLTVEKEEPHAGKLMNWIKGEGDIEQS